jgi:hypothetical protein
VKDKPTNSDGPRWPTIELVTRALNDAARDAVELHRSLGLPLVIWEDGKIVHVFADELDENGARKTPPVRTATGKAKRKPKSASRRRVKKD